MWSRLKDKSVDGSFFTNVVRLAVGTAAGQVIAVLASPLLTRLYAAQDFGVLAVYMSILGILSTVAALRYELAIPLPEDEHDAAGLLGLSLLATAVVSLMLVGLIWVLGAEGLTRVGLEVLAPYAWFVPVGVLAVGVYRSFSYWAVRKGFFDTIGRTKLYQGLGLVVSQLGLGFLALGPLGLLVGDVVGRAAGVGALISLALRKGVFACFSVRRALLGGMRYWRFPVISTFSGLINSAGLQLPAVLLAVLYGPAVAGWFALVQRVFGIPLTLIGQSVSQVYFREAAKLARSQPEALRKFYLRVMAWIWLIALMPSAVVFFTAPWFFPLIFGKGWLESGYFARYLAPVFLVQFAVAPVSQTLNILGLQTWQLGWDVFRLVSVVAVFWFAGQTGLAPRETLLYYTLALSAAYIALGILVYLGIGKSNGQSLQRKG